MKDISKLDHTQCMGMILPVRDALDVLNGKWKLPILISVTLGNKRFGEIAREIPKITDRMLSKELRELEVHGLIKRTVHDTIPVVIEYSITEYGHSLDSVIVELRKWGVQHRQRVIENYSNAK
ncbi:helix-turn-helix domain-containing protein [Flavobacterium sp. DG1-102-2]|uniref:winged helix-turn-helix transcriptional regulator n=1 Tax=Flavobacterium sp. DG1-102-2 TaxID=3081663 RepID=UPI0029491E16|nr:helix-turn-helix domain-containing protein [Flavobacterium sp. DG1-102-2]MDV6170315.1 helix-turn-helix domain-containing protein [Flavobacterium sp. DG1-102-2]